jgi:hypothetical protein
MRSHTWLSLLFGAVLLFSASLVSAQASWQSLGLEDRSINCILADDTTAILAGTDSGMSVYWNNRWYDFSLKLPVTSIVRFSSSIIFIGAGNGSKSDAVYIGYKIILGPPFYALRLQQYFIEPTAMVINNSLAIPRLYVGGRNVVSVGMIGNVSGSDTLYPLAPLKIPLYAFGLTTPYCAGLELFNGTLYAGGHDKSTMMGRPGNLLMLSTDTLLIVRRLDVTALAQGTFMEAGPLELVTGTRDSGVIYYSPSAFIPWITVPSPNKEAVNDLLTVPGMMFSDMLVAAVASGVYTSGGHSTTWTEVGDLQVSPNCCAVRGRASGSMEGVLMAGTTKGIYIYRNPSTGIAARFIPQADIDIKTKPVTCTDGKVRLSFPGLTGRLVGIAVYDESGRLYRHLSTSQSTVSFSLPAKGIYYYTCSDGNAIAIAGKIIYVK